YQADSILFYMSAFETIFFQQETIGLVGTMERLRELLARLRHSLGRDGQILLDTSTPRGRRRSPGYAGEIESQLQYRSLLGRPFRWLWVDFSVLTVCARA